MEGGWSKRLVAGGSLLFLSACSAQSAPVVAPLQKPVAGNTKELTYGVTQASSEVQTSCESAVQAALSGKKKAPLKVVVHNPTKHYQLYLVSYSYSERAARGVVGGQVEGLVKPQATTTLTTKAPLLPPPLTDEDSSPSYQCAWTAQRTAFPTVAGTGAKDTTLSLLPGEGVGATATFALTVKNNSKKLQYYQVLMAGAPPAVTTPFPLAPGASSATVRVPYGPALITVKRAEKALGPLPK